MALESIAKSNSKDIRGIIIEIMQAFVIIVVFVREEYAVTIIERIF